MRSPSRRASARKACFSRPSIYDWSYDTVVNGLPRARRLRRNQAVPTGTLTDFRGIVAPKCGPSGARNRSGMGKYVLLGPAGEVEPDPVGQEAVAGGRQRLAPLAGQHAVQLGLERVQVQHVGGGIGDLGLGEVGRTPVGELLLLGEVDPEQFAHEI